MRPLDIRHITVRNGALDLEVAVSLSHLRVREQAAERVSSILPNLVNHVCVGGAGERLGDELVGTETPHLLEHVIIELQGQVYEGGHFTGHTSWLDELANTRPQGIALMRTTVTYVNDLVALSACEHARRIVEWSVNAADGDTPDIVAMLAGLRGIMERL